MTTELAENPNRAPATSPGDDRPTRLVRTHLVVAAVFLVVSALALAAAVVQLAIPGAYAGAAPLSFGRLFPAAIAGLVLGWSTIGLVGAIHHVLPRLAGGRLVGERVAWVALVAFTLAAAGGTIAVLLGGGEGRLLQELPPWADALVLLGAVLTAGVATVTVAPARHRLGPTEWYLVGASWWFVLVGVVGVLPDAGGYAGAIQASFYRAGLFGLWLVAAGVGLVYFLVPRLAGADPMQPSSISILGFWSLAFVWAAAAPASLVYGAGPDWMETIGIAAAIGLVVPVAVIVADFVVEMRGRWEEISDRVTLRFLAAGAVALGIVPALELVAALRTSAAVVRFTPWTLAVDLLVVLGVVASWLFAFAYHVLGTGTAPARAEVARWHHRYSLLGLGLAVAAASLAGIVLGFTWAAGANSATLTAAGEGFGTSVAGIGRYLVALAVGLVVYAAAQGLLVVGAFSPVVRVASEPPIEATEPVDLEIEGGVRRVGWGSLRWGATALFVFVGLLVWILPSLDPELAEPSILADEVRTYPVGSLEAAGRARYVAEGCQTCHTQEVRAVVADVGLGPVSTAGDYAHETPIQLGYLRLGPDLMHVGSRLDAEALRAHLVDPRAERPWSFMPSYSYLSDADLDALVAYLTTLR